MIKALTFDLDDTLWDIWPVVERAEHRLHDWLAARYPRIPAQFTPLQLRELCGEIAAIRPGIAHNRTQLRKDALQLVAQRCDYVEFDVEAAFEVFYQARNAVQLFVEVRPALERLAQRYLLAALSNGNADIRLIGLDDVFSFSLNAIEVGEAKPAPRMFELARQRFNVPPTQIVHVGDDPEHDVWGAANVGFQTVWLNRTGRAWPKHLKRADVEINDLQQLEATLTQWEGAA
jgi:putative hydrolase of the HAD superfamily